jgi:hypothetical protein
MNGTQSLRRLNSLVYGLILTGSLITAQLVDAAIYYTATTGNDANLGTEAKPFH